ncbi:MAG: type II toxin-antitoxin system RelE/ParE family toxin [Phycisphaerales bacterium]|nr:type II toxin-antitoxin system RelE/ParE family toxin [Phycisphaerales bacterium]
MAWEVTIRKSARKEIRTLPHSVQRRVFGALDILSQDPTPPQSRKLVGREKTYRFRVGDYRIVYEIIEQQLLVHVIRVAHRKDIYRQL